MAFTVFEDPVSGALFVVLIVFGVFTIVVTALRFIAARQTKRQPSLEDWLALSSELVYLAFTAFSLAGTSVVTVLCQVLLLHRIRSRGTETVALHRPRVLPQDLVPKYLQ